VQECKITLAYAPNQDLPLDVVVEATGSEQPSQFGFELLIDEIIYEFSFAVTRKGGELIAKKLVAYHSRADGTEAKFEIRQESDGSQRVIDLLPAFLELSAQVSKKVYVIDEVDRSLHTLLTRRLLEMYLANCSTESRTQLLMTTHDVLLMDQQLLRRVRCG
jgi:uncharacterized protein